MKNINNSPITRRNKSEIPANLSASLATMVKKENVRIDVVTDFGADPTGGTPSDTAVSNAITSIVNSINTLSSPAILWFPQGTYTFNQPFPLITKNISIQGNGLYRTTLNFTHTNGTDCITMGNDGSPLNGVDCHGFSINGNSQTGHGLYINYAINCRFTSIGATNCGKDGIHYEKGWEVRFHDIRCTGNVGHGYYASAKMEAYSELNDINIEESYFAHNGLLGIQLGMAENTYTAEEGYNIIVKSNYLGNNGLGQIAVSGLRNVVIEYNYMEDAGTAVPVGTNAYHIYIGLRSNGGIGTAHAITIRDNHFNAMNDSHVTPAINNAMGYALILDKVIGAQITNNMFYNSVQGSIWATSSATKITVLPNIHYEYLSGAVSVKDDTNGKMFWMDNWGDVGASAGQFKGGTMSFNGQVTGNFLQKQGFENLIDNGDFLRRDSTNKPYGFSTQSFTFSIDTDGALIGTGTSGGTFQKLEFDTLNRYSWFVGKYITFCMEVKISSASTPNYKMVIDDGVLEADYFLTKDDQYHDVYVTKQISTGATKLNFLLSTTDGTAGTTNDMVYVRSMRAFLGQMPLSYGKSGTDLSITTLGQQASENLIKNGDFSLLDSSNNPLGFSTQSLTFTVDADGAIIGTGTSGGTFEKIESVLGSRYSWFKGKYVVFCAEVKIASTSTLTYKVGIVDGVSETDYILLKDDQYHDVYVVRKVDSNATQLKFSVGATDGSAGSTSDKIYVRNMRAFLGQYPLPYQKAPTDHSDLLVSTLPPASATYRGRKILVQGNGTTTADIVYECLMSATGTYSWKQVISG